MPGLRAAGRLGLPGTGYAIRKLRLAYVNPPRVWHDARRPVVKLRGTSLRVRLDLAAWPDRVVYLTGHYYERHVERLLELILRSGDVALDVGANHGMLTLRMASLVGNGGRIHAVEPNPACHARLDEQVRLNALKNVTIHRVALGERPGRARMSVPAGATGQGTLTQTTPPAEDRFEVPVATGDALAGEIRGPVCLVKLDVEGFELKALRGLEGLLSRDRPKLITEVIDGYLRRAGDSGEGLLAYLRGVGYLPYAILNVRRGLVRRLSLRAVAAGLPGDGDYLWLPAEVPVPDTLRRLGATS